MSNVIDRSFNINLTILKCARLFNPKNSRSILVQGCFLYLVFAIVVPILVLINLITTYGTSDKLEFNLNAAYACEVSCCIIKLLPFLLNADRVKNCIYYFGHIVHETYDDERQQLLEECIRTCRITSRGFAIIITLSAVAFCIKPVLLPGSGLPVDMWLPFGVETTFNYIAMYIFGIAAAFWDGSSLFMDHLIGGLICHATYQLKILKFTLQHLPRYAHLEMYKSGQMNFNKILYRMIVKGVREHNAIRIFIQEIEGCFSMSLFAPIVMCVFVLGCGMVQLARIHRLWDINLCLSLQVLTIASAQIYFPCYYGTLLFQENYTLSEAIYMSPWYEYDMKSKKLLVILIEFSKKPLVITVGKIIDLSLATYVSVLKRTYSLLALLKNTL